MRYASFLPIFLFLYLLSCENSRDDKNYDNALDSFEKGEFEKTIEFAEQLSDAFFIVKEKNFCRFLIWTWTIMKSVLSI